MKWLGHPVRLWLKTLMAALTFFQCRTQTFSLWPSVSRLRNSNYNWRSQTLRCITCMQRIAACTVPLEVQNIDEILPPPEEPQPKDPVTEKHGIIARNATKSIPRSRPRFTHYGAHCFVYEPYCYDFSSYSGKFVWPHDGTYFHEGPHDG